MIKIEELTSEDVVKYQPVFQVSYEIFQDVVGVYYKININGEEKLLHRIDGLFTIFELEDENVVSYQMFTVDENYKISDIAFEDYEMHPFSGRMVFDRRKDGLIEFIDFYERPNGEDFEGYNGNVRYVQYSPTKDMRVVIYYQHNKYSEIERIYPYHLTEPFQISIEKKVQFCNNYFRLPFTKRTFIKQKFDYRKNPMYYTFAIAKEYGTGAIFSSDPVSIHGDEEITRYYKELYVTSNYIAFTGFPFCRQYTVEELYDYITKHGFNTSIPKLLIDHHNGDLPEVNLYQELADYMKGIEEAKDYTNGSPVVLKFKFDGEEIQDGDNS